MRRDNCLRGQPAPLGAASQARSNASELSSFEALGAYQESNTSHLLKSFNPFAPPPLNGTLDGWLLDRWHAGSSAFDALFVEQFSSSSQVRIPPLRSQV